MGGGARRPRELMMLPPAPIEKVPGRRTQTPDGIVNVLHAEFASLHEAIVLQTAYIDMGRDHGKNVGIARTMACSRPGGRTKWELKGGKKTAPGRSMEE